MKSVSCVCCYGWYLKKEFVKGYLLWVVFYWDYKNRFKGFSMIYELNKIRDINVIFVFLLFLS